MSGGGVVVVISANCAAVACANHSLQSYFFQKEFFGKFIVFRHLNKNFKIFFNVILSDLNKLSLSFKTKPTKT